LLLLNAFLGNPQQSQTYTVDDKTENLLPEITNCTVTNNVPYVRDLNPYHYMDVYMPVGQGPFPAIIYIHAGGWVRGSRSDYNETALFYAKRGIAGFAIDYTLTIGNQTAWPKNAQDVFKAIRFITENAQLYRIDPARIAVFGSSAGAQFASLAGTLSGEEVFLHGASGNESIKKELCLVVDYSGATDFDYIGKYENGTPIYRILTSALGNVSYSMNPDLWIQASAATYISSDDPIFFLAHGTNDTIVPIAVADSFNAKLQAAGVETHFIRVKDGDHDMLTSQVENLVVRQSLEPLLRRVFKLDQQTVSEFPTPIIFPLALTITLIAAVIFRRNLSKTPFSKRSLTKSEKEF
jgi:acetyl esterase/lipase